MKEENIELAKEILDIVNSPDTQDFLFIAVTSKNKQDWDSHYVYTNIFTVHSLLKVAEVDLELVIAEEKGQQ